MAQLSHFDGFTEYDKCTFEALTRSYSNGQTAVSVLLEIIHDLDLKNSKFNQVTTTGDRKLMEVDEGDWLHPQFS